MLEQRIQQHFFESADLQYQAAEVMSRPVAEAVQAIVAGVTAGGRLLVGGRGAAAGLARRLCAAMLEGFERERPGLAALLLGGIDVDWSRQVETLGQPGDLLLLVDTDGDAPALVAAAEAAQGKDMTVIALTGRSGGVPHDRRARVLEAQLLVLHCLCDSIDLQLLGEEDPA
jgi:D-sedoheptulose 7-phosphate isomerase